MKGLCQRLAGACNSLVPLYDPFSDVKSSLEAYFEGVNNV